MKICSARGGDPLGLFVTERSRLHPRRTESRRTIALLPGLSRVRLLTAATRRHSPRAFFTVIDTGGVVATDPLAPTVPRKLSAIFVTGQIWVTDKPEMGFKASLGDRFAQTCDAAGNTASAGIPVGAFKTEYVKLYIGS